MPETIALTRQSAPSQEVVVAEQPVAAVGRQRPGSIPALTSLRFLAAVYVVLFHLSSATMYPYPLNRIIDQGRAGVAFFFILSGFILTYNYTPWFRTGTGRAWQFYRARLARIYPMYIVGLLVCTPVTLYMLSTSPAFASRWTGGTIMPRDVVVSWVTNLFALQAFVPLQWMQYFWNGPGWSIGAEFFFYALFPFVGRYVFTRLRTPRALLLLLVGLLAWQWIMWLAPTLWIAAHLRFLAYDDAMDLFVYKPPIMRLPEFLIGCTLGALFLQALDNPDGHPLRHFLRSGFVRNAALLIAALAFITVIWIPTPESVVLVLYPMKFYLLFTPVFALMILTFACGRTALHRVLEHRWALLLGEASYSVYILHGSIRMLLTPDASQTSGSIPAGLILLIIAAIVLVSIACYFLIEVPARRALRPRSKPTEGTLPGLLQVAVQS